MRRRWAGTVMVAAWLGASGSPSAAVGWQRLAVPTTETLQGVDFPAPDVGYAVGRHGTALKTVDGGVTWATLGTGTTDDLLGVAFLDARNGVAVGGSVAEERGIILRTADGGATWRQVAIAPKTFQDVVVSGTRVLASGTLRAVSTDGGRSFFVDPSP